MKNIFITLISSSILMTASIQADQVFLDDVIVGGSACIGQDCVNGESFGFDTIRMKENNLRIKAQDTSNSASFPTNDWQITFNDSSNGGANKFSIDDIDGGKTPFTIEAGAPSNSLYVDDGGKIGLGTSTPVVEVHVKDGDTPTIRLEQDGSSGFTPQTWDMAGNESNFFVRDVTNGSKLPFKIRPNAPTGSIDITTSGVKIPDITGSVSISGTGVMLMDLESTDDNAAQIRIKTNSSNRRLVSLNSSDIVKSQIVLGDDEVQIAGASNVSNLYATFNATGLTVNGTITPDYVFKDNYKLMPLEQVKSFVNKNKHLPEVPSEAEIDKKGLNMTEMQMILLKKVEELTLYTIEQQDTIEQLQLKLVQLEHQK